MDSGQEELMPMPEDASRYLAEMKKEALGVLFPSPSEQDERMSLITILKGKAPNMYTLYLAAVEWECWLAMEQRRKIDWDKLDPVLFIRAHAPSILGKGRKDAVEIARAAPSNNNRSLLDVLRGR